MNDTRASRAPDGGWGWVVLAATVPIIAINNSIFGTFSLLFGGLLKSTGADATMTAWIFNIGTAFWSISSLIAGPLSNIYSHRSVSVTAGILIALGLFLSHLITSAWQLFITYSIFVGFGCGLIYSSSFLLVNLYFNERRGLALGVFNASATLGRMLFPLAEHWLLEVFTNAGTVLLTSGIALHLIPCAMLYHPVEQHLRPAQKTAIHDRDDETSAYARRLSSRRRHSFSNTADSQEESSMLQRPDSCEPEFFKCPTSTPKKLAISANVRSAAKLSASTSSNIHKKTLLRTSNRNAVADHGRKSAYLLSPNSGSKAPVNSSAIGSTFDIFGSSVVAFDFAPKSQAFQRFPTEDVDTATSDSSRGIHPDEKSISLAKKIFQQLDYTLLRNPMLLILLLADCLYWLTYFNFVLMMPISVQEKGLSRHDTATLLALPPVSDIVIRICVPLMVDRGWVDCRTVYLLGLGMVLLSILLFPFVDSIEMMYLSCLTFGVGCGAAVTHFGLVLVYYFGVDNLPSTKGFTMFSNGFCYVALGPLLGYYSAAMTIFSFPGLLRTSTGNFAASYYMLAVCMTVSLLLWTFEPWAKQYAPTATACDPEEPLECFDVVAEVESNSRGDGSATSYGMDPENDN